LYFGKFWNLIIFSGDLNILIYKINTFMKKIVKLKLNLKKKY